MSEDSHDPRTPRFEGGDHPVATMSAALPLKRLLIAAVTRPGGVADLDNPAIRRLAAFAELEEAAVALDLTDGAGQVAVEHNKEEHHAHP